MKINKIVIILGLLLNLNVLSGCNNNYESTSKLSTPNASSTNNEALSNNSSISNGSLETSSSILSSISDSSIEEPIKEDDKNYGQFS